MSAVSVLPGYGFFLAGGNVIALIRALLSELCNGALRILAFCREQCDSFTRRYLFMLNRT